MKAQNSSPPRRAINTSGGNWLCIAFETAKTATLLSITGIGLTVIFSNVAVLIIAAPLAGCGQSLRQLEVLPLIIVHVQEDRSAEANVVMNIGGDPKTIFPPFSAG